ncbi:MAG: SpoIVB peptidase [Clostridia bacterium]|nr:SpoIVB peptidase [Clostridia bacterium]
MKYIKLAVRTVFFAAALVSVTVFTAVIVLSRSISPQYKINKGDVFTIDTSIPVTAYFGGVKASQMEFKNVGDVFDAELKILGIIPFAKTSVTVVDETYVSVLGTPFGMKVYTDGVLVIQTGEVQTSGGSVDPSRAAGINVGDYIRRANGAEITCNEDLVQIVSESGGESISLEIVRGGNSKTVEVTPARSSEDGSYRIGIWVRDSSAGIGTLTFYSPVSNIVCGLGHGICDSDTGELLMSEHGELVGAEIISVKKGASGNPGELKGKFTYKGISDILLNTENGVYGRPYQSMKTAELTEVALKQEIKNGDAQILCTVSGSEPQLYSCTVKKRTSAYNSATQNMIITVTDRRLIDLTGGIIQGMSGSPVLQNGKLIGAVTHVFIDDPRKGYAVYAENMLDTVFEAAELGLLKEAS